MAAGGRSAAQQSAPAQPAPAAPAQVPANRDRAITLYIQDFELDAADVTTDQRRHGIAPLHRITGREESSDPQSVAQHVVNLMSASLLEDFTKAGYTAKRLGPDDSRPAFGILISGVFTELDEGNRLRRAVIGFGAGAANMQIYVTATDLQHPEQALYQAARDDSSGKAPGAVITMNPAVAAVKFVMSKGATDKTVKKTAKQVVSDFDKRMQTSSATIATWSPDKSAGHQEPLNKYAKP
jgi:hypothetical protein